MGLCLEFLLACDLNLEEEKVNLNALLELHGCRAEAESYFIFKSLIWLFVNFASSLHGSSSSTFFSIGRKVCIPYSSKLLQMTLLSPYSNPHALLRQMTPGTYTTFYSILLLTSLITNPIFSQKTLGLSHGLLFHF
jgi:hypothetical protein